MTTPAANVTWPSLVGYQYEVLHTGVLATLLDDSDVGPSLAADLIGEPVLKITDVHRERRLPGAPGIADLVAEYTAASGESRYLGVETKVHSNGSLGQLLATTGERTDANGVLLALGFTALKMSSFDTASASAEAGANWNFVDPSRWLDVLDRIAAAPPWLADYKREVSQWSQALKSGQADWSDDARLQTELGHLRYLADLREGLHDPAAWRAIVTSQSGPLLSLFAWSTPGRDIYLEVMGYWRGRRVLTLKVGGDPAQVPELLEEISSLASSVPQLGPPRLRRLRKGQKSATVAQLELPTDPLEGAAVVNDVERRIWEFKGGTP